MKGKENFYQEGYINSFEYFYLDQTQYYIVRMSRPSTLLLAMDKTNVEHIILTVDI